MPRFRMVPSILRERYKGIQFGSDIMLRLTFPVPQPRARVGILNSLCPRHPPNHFLRLRKTNSKRQAPFVALT